MTNLQSRRYNELNMSVSTLNEQINELVASTEGIEADIEVWERSIKNAKKLMARNEKMAEKLRAKRQIVAEAAFKAAAIDQP
jgi:chromosome segregation ATPase